MATTLAYPLAVQRPSLPGYIDAAVCMVVDWGRDASRIRMERMEQLRTHALALQDLSDAILGAHSASLSVAVVAKNPALWCAFIDGLGLPCTGLPAKLFREGASVIGVQDDTWLWALKSDEAFEASRPTMEVEELRRSAEQYVRTLRTRLAASARMALRSPNSDETGLLQAAWDSAIKEVRLKDSATGPFSFDVLRRRFHLTGSRAMRPLLRFPVIQDDGINVKVRGVDDGAFASTNCTYQSREVVTNMP